MEVTTVSPSPTSPTEGDELCEIDVTNVAIHSVTLLISLCGLLGNGAVLLILRSCKTGTFVLALSDFLFLLFTVPSALLLLMEDVSCSPIMPLDYLNGAFQLSVMSCYSALFWVTLHSNIDYMLKLYKLCCCCSLPDCVFLLVVVVQYMAFAILIILSPAVTNLCPSHQQEHCRAALMSIYTLILLLFAAPMVIPSTINFIKAKCGPTEQQPKRRDIVVFIMVLFILLLSLCNVPQQLGYTVVSSDVFFLLNSIHSSTKPFLYFLAAEFQRPYSRKSLQLSLQRVFDKQKDEAAHRNDPSLDTVV